MYEDRIVAYLDILGFSELIKSTESDESKANDISAILKVSPDDVRRTMGAQGYDNTNVDLRLTAFSDSVVVSVRDVRPNILHLLYTMQSLSYKMIRMGRLLRGAVAKGRMVHTADAVFGPAFIDAYRLEQMVLYPRIVIVEDLARGLGIVESTTPPSATAQTYRYDDGLIHINPAANLYEKRLTEVRECLCLIGSASDNLRDRVKIKWAITAWNREFKKHNIPVIVETEITYRKFDLFAEMERVRKHYGVHNQIYE